MIVARTTAELCVCAILGPDGGPGPAAVSKRGVHVAVALQVQVKTIFRNDFEECKKLDTGGHIYLAQNKMDRLNYAVKKVANRLQPVDPTEEGQMVQ
jgi:hypothetical protein